MLSGGEWLDLFPDHFVLDPLDFPAYTDPQTNHHHVGTADNQERKHPMTQAKKEASKGYVRDIVTGVGRVAFPHLESTNEGGEYPSHKFEVHFLLPKTDTATRKLLADSALKAAQEKWPHLKLTLADIKISIKDGDEKAHLDGFPGAYYINPKANKKPLVVGLDKAPLPEGQRVRGGDYVRLAVTAGAYPQNLEKENYDMMKEAGKKVVAEPKPDGKGMSWYRPAVTFYLDMVQKVKDGDSFGSAVKDPSLFPDAEPITGSGPDENDPIYG